LIVSFVFVTKYGCDKNMITAALFDCCALWAGFGWNGVCVVCLVHVFDRDRALYFVVGGDVVVEQRQQWCTTQKSMGKHVTARLKVP